MSVKKILALLLAAMMVFGMTSALADTSPIRTNTTATMDIPLTKTLYFKNADANTVVYEPNITYTYTVAPFDPAGATITVTDATGHTAAVKKGDMRAFNSADATTAKAFELKYDAHHNSVTVPANGIGVTKKTTMAFDGTKIKSENNDIVPGVYRYSVTESVTPTKAAAGIIDGSNADVLYLDVFVKNDGTVSGAVIHEPGFNPTDPVNNDDGDHKDDKTPSENENGKTTGFGGGEDPTNPDPIIDPNDDGEETDNTTETNQQSGTTNVDSSFDFEKEDLYITYNVTVKKLVTGTMGDKANFFPFQAQISDSIENAKFTYAVTTNTGKEIAATAIKVGTSGATTLGGLTSDSAIALKDNGVLTITGVPTSLASGNTGVKVTVDENNNTLDDYTNYGKFVLGSSTTDLVGTATEFANLVKGTSTATSAQVFKADSTPAVTFTNNLDAVSPTGVVLRFAPYFAMFAAGCVLFLILATKRSKKEEE